MKFSDRYDTFLHRYEHVNLKMPCFAKILPLTWANEVKCWSRTKKIFVIARSRRDASTVFFFAKLYDNQAPIAMGSYQPLAKVAKYGKRARVNCGTTHQLRRYLLKRQQYDRVNQSWCVTCWELLSIFQALVYVINDWQRKQNVIYGSVVNK